MVDRSRGALALVVGEDHVGVNALMGHVADYCRSRAGCRVVVVPHGVATLAGPAPAGSAPAGSAPAGTLVPAPGACARERFGADGERMIMKAATDIVVGFDGSPGAECAVDWAAHEAGRRGVGLSIVTAKVYVELPFGGLGAGGVPPRDPSESASGVVAEGRLRAEKILDEARISTVTIWGQPAGALVNESRGASLVVVGHPERGMVREYITGSVAFAVAAHAKCDVAVVPQGDVVMPGPDHPVVVGADGSTAALQAALRAAEIASRWHASLQIVRAWHLPSLTGWAGPGGGAAPQPDEIAFYKKAARDSVDSAAAAVRESFPDVVVEPVVVEAHPVVALLDAAERAGLLVVGTRGLGGFRRLLLGSVSRAVIHYAERPVIVVRT